MHEPWQERIGDFTGDYYKEALPVEMADKTVLAMKVASETGGVVVKHSLPHTLAAVGCYNGEQGLKWAILGSKEYMDRADLVHQTGEKPWHQHAGRARQSSRDQGVDKLVRFVRSRIIVGFVRSRIKITEIGE